MNWITTYQRNHLRLIKMVFLASITNGCATSVTITSTPPAVDVYDGDVKIGTTPFEISPDKLKTISAGGYLIRLKKDSYQTVWVWMPTGIRKMTTNVNLQPFVKTKNAEVATNLVRTQLDDLAAKLLQLETDLLVKSEVPGEQLAELKKSYAGLGAVHYLSALNYLRQNDQKSAVIELEQAMRFSASEPDYVMLYKEINPTAKEAGEN